MKNTIIALIVVVIIGIGAFVYVRSSTPKTFLNETHESKGYTVSLPKDFRMINEADFISLVSVTDSASTTEDVLLKSPYFIQFQVEPASSNLTFAESEANFDKLNTKSVPYTKPLPSMMAKGYEGIVPADNYQGLPAGRSIMLLSKKGDWLILVSGVRNESETEKINKIQDDMVGSIQTKE